MGILILRSSAVAQSSAPAWFEAATEKVWGEATSNTIRDVLPDPLPTNGEAEIATGWTGAWFDAVNREYGCTGNGGHDGYGGNETYSVLVGSETPAWRRLSDPSSTSGGDATRNGPGTYGDGKMRASHNSHSTVFAKGRVWIPGMWGMTGSGTNGTTAVWSCDRSSLGTGPFPVSAAESPYAHHGFGWETVPGGDYSFEGGAAWYDPIAETVYRIVQFCNEKGGWSVDIADPENPIITGIDWAFGGNPFGDACGAPIIEDATHRWMVMLSEFEERLWILDLNDIADDWVQQTTTGTGKWTGGNGCVYHPPSRKLLVYDYNEGATIHALTVPTNPKTADDTEWVWSTVSNGTGGITPADPASNPNGVYGKFQLCPDMGNGQGCLFMFNSIDNPLYYYKLPVGAV